MACTEGLSTTWRDLPDIDLLTHARTISSLMSRSIHGGDGTNVTWMFGNDFAMVTTPEVKCPWCSKTTTSPLAYLLSTTPPSRREVYIRPLWLVDTEQGMEYPKGTYNGAPLWIRREVSTRDMNEKWDVKRYAHPHFNGSTGTLCYDGSFDTGAWALSNPNPSSPLWGGSDHLPETMSASYLIKWDRYAIFQCSHDCPRIRAGWKHLLEIMDWDRLATVFSQQTHEAEAELRPDEVPHAIQDTIHACHQGSSLRYDIPIFLYERQKSVQEWTDEWADWREAGGES